MVKQMIPHQTKSNKKRENELLRKQLQKVIAQRDASDEFSANMLNRSNKAVRERNESNYALKVALTEKEKFKQR